MKNQDLQLVTFTQAERLDAVGFDWETRYRFDYNSVGSITETSTERNHNDRFKWTNKDKQGCSAPTVALALKWMRDVKNIVCGIHVRDDRAHSDAPYVGVYEWGDNESFYAGGGAKHTYESAESSLLDELLTLLENK